MDQQPGGYLPPPQMTAPPTGWRPVHLVEPAAPRVLPPQDHLAIDAAEERAQTVTRTYALIAGVTIMALTILLCGRAIF